MDIYEVIDMTPNTPKILPKEVVHDKVNVMKYPCNQCDKQFTVKEILKKHILNVHEGLR